MKVFNLLAFASLALVLFVMMATETTSLEMSENVFLKGGRSVLHKRDYQDDPRVSMIKEIFHYDQQHERLGVTILKKGGGRPSDYEKEVLGKLFNFTLLAEDLWRSEGWLDLDSLDLSVPLTEEEQRAIDDLIIKPIVRPVTNAFFSEGVASEKANEVVKNYGYSGQGVVVGIISDSFNLDGNLGSKISSGELPSRPGAITILKEGTSCTTQFNGGSGCTDEGRRMAEIIYDTAPNANYLFYSAIGGSLNQVQAILSLAANGAQIIADDIIYLTQPWFEAGPIYNAVSQVASSSIYVISAGNFGQQSVQQIYKDSSSQYSYTKNGATVTEPTHEFSKGKNYITLPLPAGRSIIVVLQWAEPWPQNGATGAQTDLDLIIEVDDKDKAFVTGRLLGVENSIGNEPYEIAALRSTSTVKAKLIVARASGGNTPLFKIVVTPQDSSITKALSKKIKNYQPSGSNAKSTILAQALNPLGITIGAADYSSKKPQVYTSAGGSPFYTSTGTTLVSPQVFKKPDILGPDNVSTSVGRFPGSSCSAASIAGVLALLKEGTPTLTTSQALEALQTTAIDVKPKGFDFVSGYGYPDALSAADELKSS